MIAEPNDRAKHEVVQELLRNIYALQMLGVWPRPEDYEVSGFTELAFMALDRHKVEGHCNYAFKLLKELLRKEESLRSEAGGGVRNQPMRRGGRAEAWGVGTESGRFVWGSAG